MNNQVYLLLVRGSDALPKSPAAIGVALKGLLVDMIRGDSLDVPYVNFIRVSSIGQSIGGIAAEFNYSDASERFGMSSFSEDYNKSFKEFGKALLSTDQFRNMSFKSLITGDNHQNTNRFAFGSLGSHLPTQGTMSFTKQLDGATPQLAYGCSAQEPFRFALFYFQRKAAPNLGGVVFPQLVVGLHRVMIRKWDMADDTEKITLGYEKICWGAYNQWADSPLPQSVSTRYWDAANSRGGHGVEPFCLFTLGLTTAIWGLSAGLLAASHGAS